MAFEFDIRDPKNQKMIAAFLIPVVIIAVFYNFIIKPKMIEINSKKTEIAKLQVQINSIQKTLQSEVKLQETKNELMAKLKELDSLLPVKENVGMLLDQFVMVEKDAKVYLVGFNAIEIIEGGDKPYRANKYRVTVEAGYHQFATFMSKVMALPRILSLSDLNISLNPMMAEQEAESYEGLEDQPRYLTVECTLTSYVYKSTNDGS